MYHKTCIFFFFPIINKYLCMAKRSLLSRCPSYLPLCKIYIRISCTDAFLCNAGFHECSPRYPLFHPSILPVIHLSNYQPTFMHALKRSTDSSVHLFSFYYGATALMGLRPTHYRGFMITLRHTTLGRTPLCE